MEEALVLASAFLQDHKTRIVVKKNRFEAQQLYQRLDSILDNVLLFVMEESLRVQAIASSPEDKEQFITFLSSCILEPKECIIVCNTAAFIRILPDFDFFLLLVLHVKLIWNSIWKN